MRHRGIAASASLSLLLAAFLLVSCAGSSAGLASSALAATAASAKTSTSAPAAGSTTPASGAANSAQPVTTGDQAQFDQLVAAAKKEGTVSVITPPGATYRQILDAFNKRYGISVEVVTGNGIPDLVPLISSAQKSGKVLWDVIVHNPRVMFSGLKPLGILDPLRPALIEPEALDTSKWIGGFEAGWADLDKNLDYTFVNQAGDNVMVNRDVIPESQLSTIDQLWDPKWKGKIAIQDPKAGSAGSNVLGTWFVAKGEAKLRDFIRTTQPTITLDRRQLMDWVVRGEYPIIIGPDPATQADYKANGVDMKNLQILGRSDPSGRTLSAGTGAEALFKGGPHGNAGKLLANWLLTQEGQQDWAKTSGYNSRRLDVPVTLPDLALDPNVQYVNLQIEANYKAQEQAIQIAVEEFK